MKNIICLTLSLLILSLSTGAQTALSPLDFGLSLTEYGRIDYSNLPSHIRIAQLNEDDYLDIARFSGSKLEVFFALEAGYPAEPQRTFQFDQAIADMRPSGSAWVRCQGLKVTLQNGQEHIISWQVLNKNSVGSKTKIDIDQPPRRVSEAEFQIVWESETCPYGMNCLATGDLDNDGIEELVTWWKEYEAADSAWILIYKCVGDDEFELFMEEPVDNDLGNPPGLSNLIITDLDQNGWKELIYTYNKAYIWEFESPGVYHRWESNYSFCYFVADWLITDVDDDDVLELAVLCTNTFYTPPTIYFIKEFGYKTTAFDSLYIFTNITGIAQDWPDYRFDVGDFDNDDVIDIVCGNSGYWTTYDPYWLQYYRWDWISPTNFSLEWMNVGIPLTCANPVIEDFDGDGQNELFCGGLFPNGGSSFLWESTGTGTGYASWLDTTHMVFGPNESAFGIVDANPAVVSQVITSGTDHSSTILYLFGKQNGAFGFLWQSDVLDSMSCHSPVFSDIDQDGKMNLLMSVPYYSSLPNWVADWEQTSAGIWEQPFQPSPQEFHLHGNYPNPFNCTTVIPFELSRPSDIRLCVYDISGRIVYEFSEENMHPGHYAIDWDAAGCASGVYVFELSVSGSGASPTIARKKGVLLK